jgi:hypothetical protein
MSSRLVAAGVIVIAIAAASSPPLRQLHPILFSDGAHLCSISLVDTARVCLPGVHKGDAAWSPDGKKVIVDGGTILNDSGQRIGAIHNFTGVHPVWSPKGQYIYTADSTADNTFHRWDQQGRNGQPIHVESESKPKRFQMVSFSPRGQHAALLNADNSALAIADVNTKGFAVKRTVAAGFAYVSQSVWIDEDTLLFVGKRRPKSRGTLWRVIQSSGAVDSIGIRSLILRDQIVVAPDRSSVIVTAASTNDPSRWNVWYFEPTSRITRRLTSGTDDIVRSWR